MALYHFSAKVLSRSSRNTVGALAYRAGCKLYDDKTGLSFDYRSKPVEYVELLLPKDAPEWALEIQKLIIMDRQKGVQALCDQVESAEKRIDAQVWREFEFALHRELTKEQNMALAREFVQDQICGRGMAAQLNFHFDVDKETGDEKPHCHVVMTTRPLDENGLSPKKEREWNKKEFLNHMRVQWQDYSNFHLKLHGHDIQIDHRCNKDRGIDMEPQPKMGKNVLELEKRLQKLEGDENHTPITDKAKAFHDTQLRNLYRIMRRPEVALEIASKHNATFMWVDVQKVLHRYVDEVPLFQRLEAKLKNSSELILLKADPEGLSQSIYTTRTLLKTEKSLVETAETLNRSKSHAVKEYQIWQALRNADKSLKEHGGLSKDQRRAIWHMADEGQLRCLVGIAGAGKTTALGVCQDIWKAEGYAVYGLAPTGKAVNNLEQSGISSMTLHKFLKSFEEGRCQYNPNSVLVLDEAGMVDIERLAKLLDTVKQLGVKLIVVGDGAQLQPVEAGPAFRLITNRLGKAELNTVLRQKEEWQKEATVLFGRQQTQEAIQKYVDKGHVHIVEEKIPSFSEALANNDKKAIINLYEIATRQSSRIFREIMNACPRELERSQVHGFIRQHQDFERYLAWENLEKSAAGQILKEGEPYRSLLGVRAIDPTKMAELFVNKNLDKTTQQTAITNLLKEKGLDILIGMEKKPGQSVDLRQEAKAELVNSWHSAFKENPEKQSLMLAYSNRDVNDLNASARSLLKASGHISKDDFIYTVAKMAENDFGDKQTIKEEKSFSKGDRIVFTHNNYGLGVKNGTMGIVTELDKRSIQVKLDEGNSICFAPNLNPHFDQGWAITIHKSQGTTVDKSYVLASYEMTQNLAYVSMTRHREDVHVFGSSLDFWRPEKLPEVLAKSGEKLSAADYLDTDSLNKLMQKEDHLLTKIFNRISNELEAMGTVSEKTFWQVADHFLGVNRDKEIIIKPEVSKEAIREETRAEELLKAKVAEAKDAISRPANEKLDYAPSPTTTRGRTTEPQQKQPSSEWAKQENKTNEFSSGNSSHLTTMEPTETNFTKLTRACEQRLYDYLDRHNMPLTPQRFERIPLQAERAATFIQHVYGDTAVLPPEQETVNFCLRAKYELNRLPEIQRDLMDQGEDNPFRAYRIADRLASIEGRLYLEARLKGTEPLYPSYDAKKELARHRDQLPHLIQDLKQWYYLSNAAAQNCAQDILRYKETHGENPSGRQMEKMIEISRQLEDKEYGYHSRGSAETEFLRRREGDLLFKHGLGYDASRDLNSAQVQVEKSLRDIQRQMEQDRQHSKQMEMGL